MELTINTPKFFFQEFTKGAVDVDGEGNVFLPAETIISHTRAFFIALGMVETCLLKEFQAAYPAADITVNSQIVFDRFVIKVLLPGIEIDITDISRIVSSSIPEGVQVELTAKTDSEALEDAKNFH